MKSLPERFELSNTGQILVFVIKAVNECPFLVGTPVTFLYHLNYLAYKFSVNMKMNTSVLTIQKVCFCSCSSPWDFLTYKHKHKQLPFLHQN